MMDCRISLASRTNEYEPPCDDSSVGGCHVREYIVLRKITQPRMKGMFGNVSLHGGLARVEKMTLSSKGTCTFSTW